MEDSGASVESSAPELADLPISEGKDAKVSKEKSSSKEIGTPREKVDEKAPQTEAEKVAEKIRLKFKAKILGKEEDVDLDEDTIKRDFQKWKAADKMFQDAAMMRKQNESLLSKLKDRNGLAEALQALGYDPRVLAEEYLTNELQMQMMTPEQRRIRELEMEKAQREWRDKQRADEEKRSKQGEISERLTKEIQTDIVQAIDSSDLPRTPETIRRIAKQMQIYGERGVWLHPSQVIDIVRDQIISENQSILSKMTPEQMMKYLSKEKLEEFRKWELSQVKNPIPPPKEKVTQKKVVKPEDRKRHYVTEDEFKKRMARMKAG